MKVDLKAVQWAGWLVRMKVVLLAVPRAVSLAGLMVESLVDNLVVSLVWPMAASLFVKMV